MAEIDQAWTMLSGQSKNLIQRSSRQVVGIVLALLLKLSSIKFSAREIHFHIGLKYFG